MKARTLVGYLPKRWTGEWQRDFEALVSSLANILRRMDDIPSLVKFPSVAVDDPDANTLDDYEEGTWTPVLTFGTPGTLSVAYSVQVGDYTKVGRDVRVSCSIITSSFTLGTATGNLKVTGLPFTIGGGTSQAHLGALVWGGITKTNYTSIAARALNGNGTEIDFLASGSGQAVSQVTATDTPTGGTVRLEFTVNYRV